MHGYGGIILLVGILIVVINSITNSSSLFKIIRYCLQTNSVSQYWPLVFKTCFSGRALFSSAIAFVLALAIFIILAPALAVRSAFYEKKRSYLVREGLWFPYNDLDLGKYYIKFRTNFVELTGIDLNHIQASGKFRADAILVLAEIDARCKFKNVEYEVALLSTIKLTDGGEAQVPILFSTEGKTFPIYFIYNETHNEQFQKIKSKLYETGYKDCIYFTTLSYQSQYGI